LTLTNSSVGSCFTSFPADSNVFRYFGFLANRYRAEKLALCQQLMQMPPPTVKREANKDYRDQYEALTGISLKTCPLCRCGTMVVIETFERSSSRTPFTDTS
jgi:hypothetical protein